MPNLILIEASTRPWPDDTVAEWFRPTGSFDELDASKLNFSCMHIVFCGPHPPPPSAKLDEALELVSSAHCVRGKHPTILHRGI